MREEKIVLIPTITVSKEFIESLENLKKEEFLILLVKEEKEELEKTFLEEIAKYAKVINVAKEGKGSLLKAGLKQIKEKYFYDATIVVAEDLSSYTIIDIVRLYKETIQNKEAYILGKRSQKEKKTLLEKLENAYTKTTYQIISGEKIEDPSTGLKAFNSHLIDFLLTVNGEDTDYERNILLKCASNKIAVKEVDIVTINKEEKREMKEIKNFEKIPITDYLIDYFVFIFLNQISNHLFVSNIFARLMSSLFHFHKKRDIHKDLKKGAIEYFSMIGILLIIDTILLNVFANLFSMTPWVAKIFTEILFALFAYGVE